MANQFFDSIFDSITESGELSRAQMKNILGGNVNPGSCKTSRCTLSEYIEFPNGNGYWQTNNGTCDTAASGNCFCDLGDDQEHPLGSNGGVSRCAN